MRSAPFTSNILRLVLTIGPKNIGLAMRFRNAVLRTMRSPSGAEEANPDQLWQDSEAYPPSREARQSVATVAHAELSFEIGAPNMIGSEYRRIGLSGMSDRATSASTLDHAFTAQQFACGSASRQHPFRMAALQDSQQLLRTPCWMSVAKLDECLDEGRRRRIG
jgi:hypothetical protein